MERQKESNKRKERKEGGGEWKGEKWRGGNGRGEGKGREGIEGTKERTNERKSWIKDLLDINVKVNVGH